MVLWRQLQNLTACNWKVCRGDIRVGTVEAAAGAIQNLTACNWKVCRGDIRGGTVEAAAGAIQNLTACNRKVWIGRNFTYA